MTNEYVFQGVSGGMPGLIAFVVMIVLCYRCVGRLWRRHTGDRYRLLSSWALGCCLFAHTMSFISVSYFGQAKVIWFLLLASIASLTPTREAKPTPVGTRLQKLGHAIQ